MSGQPIARNGCRTALDVDHVLLTRFNLPSVSAEGVIRSRSGWLEDRVGLFERYCIPSVAAQCNRNFTWLIYFDPDSPQWLKDRICDHEARGIYRPMFRSSVSREELCADIRVVAGARGGCLITTNLDNDDGLATDFVDRVQKATPLGARTAIYLSRGLIKGPGGLYAVTDVTNAFCSVRESWDAPSTCWCDWHTLLGETMPVVQLAGTPAWLQVVHGMNVSNRIRGARISPESHRAVFPGLLDDVPGPSAGEAVIDLLVARPIRDARLLLRASAKAIALKLLGKDGLTRAKMLLAARMRRQGVHRA